MNAIVTPKSQNANLFEGIALTALLKGVPAFTASVLVLKLLGTSQSLAHGFGAVIFVLTSAAFMAVATALFGPKHPRVFMNYQPAFFDPSLTCYEKIVRWRDLPNTSVELLGLVMMLTPLAIAVVAIR